MSGTYICEINLLGSSVVYFHYIDGFGLLEACVCTHMGHSLTHGLPCL